MTVSARVLVPIEIANAMISAGTTIAEPDTAIGESAWVSAGTYALDTEKTYGGSIWYCVTAHSGRTGTPDIDAAYWKRIGPTNRMAALDDYNTTKSRATAALTFVLQPGFFNGIALYGLEGSGYAITVKDAPGGTVISASSGDLYAQAAGFYELLFSPLLQMEQLSFDDVPLAPAAEVTITITSGPGKPVAIGAIKVGDWRQFIGDGSGGVQYGAESNRKTYTFRQYNLDGTYTMVKRPSSRDIQCSVVIDADQSMYASAILDEIIDTAVPFEATGLPRYGYLNTLGFVSGGVRADNFGVTSINLQIKGNV